MIKTSSEMREWAMTRCSAGRRIGFVPTMGYLHDGHLSLVRLARQQSDLVVVSIFVNPTQFGPREDLARYPRDLLRDESMCRTAGVDAVFCPDVSDIYPDGYSTYVEEEALSRVLCGASRPGHFRGVTTVVAKLFTIVSPHAAVFGKKDAQQLRVIRRMVRDLNLPVEIVAGPTAREVDGLAMSSRNKFLDPEERAQAVCIDRGLQAAKKLFSAGERGASRLRESVMQVIGQSSLARVDYLEIVDDETLRPIDIIERKALIAAAVFFGGTRLIDNLELDPAAGSPC